MNPIFFRYGGLAIRYSQLIFLSAFLVAYNLSMRSKQSEFSGAEREHALYSLIVGGLIGGRSSYILVNWDLYSGRWLEGLTLWHGAFTLWGSLLGFWLSAIFGQKFSKLPQEIWPWITHRIAFTFPLFLAFAQWALWFEGEGWGKFGRGWGVLIQSGLARYPLWLYLFIGYLGLSLYLYFVNHQRNRFYQMIIGIGLIQLVFTPMMLFGDLKDLTFHLVWSFVLLLLSMFALIPIKRKDRPT